MCDHRGRLGCYIDSRRSRRRGSISATLTRPNRRLKLVFWTDLNAQLSRVCSRLIWGQFWCVVGLQWCGALRCSRGCARDWVWGLAPRRSPRSILRLTHAFGGCALRASGGFIWILWCGLAFFECCPFYLGVCCFSDVYQSVERRCSGRDVSCVWRVKWLYCFDFFIVMFCCEMTGMYFFI